MAGRPAKLPRPLTLHEDVVSLSKKKKYKVLQDYTNYISNDTFRVQIPTFFVCQIIQLDSIFHFLCVPNSTSRFHIPLCVCPERLIWIPHSELKAVSVLCVADKGANQCQIINE